MLELLSLIAAFVLCFEACRRLHILDQWHHFWIGAALAVFPFLPEWVTIVGHVVMWDDAIQHAIQLRRPQFRSPLHLLYRHLLYEPFLNPDRR